MTAALRHVKTLTAIRVRAGDQEPPVTWVRQPYLKSDIWVERVKNSVIATCNHNTLKENETYKIQHNITYWWFIRDRSEYDKRFE